MSKRLKIFTIIVFVAFNAMTVWAAIQHPLPQWPAAIIDGGGVMWQIFLDLVVACVICCGWIVRDARERAQNPIPYVILTAIAGSIGLLLYLIMRRPMPSAGAQCTHEPDAEGKLCLKCFNPMTWGSSR